VFSDTRVRENNFDGHSRDDILIIEQPSVSPFQSLLIQPSFITSLCSISPIRVLFNVRTFDISIRLVSRPFSPSSFSSFPAQFFAKHAARGLGAVIPEKREKCSRDNASHRASQTDARDIPRPRSASVFRAGRKCPAPARATILPAKGRNKYGAIATITLRSRCKRPGRDGDITALSASLGVDPSPSRFVTRGAREADFSALSAASTWSVRKVSSPLSINTILPDDRRESTNPTAGTSLSPQFPQTRGNRGCVRRHSFPRDLVIVSPTRSLVLSHDLRSEQSRVARRICGSRGHDIYSYSRFLPSPAAERENGKGAGGSGGRGEKCAFLQFRQSARAQSVFRGNAREKV